MTVWTVELKASPPLERPHQKGFIVCVQIESQSDERIAARFWRREFEGMEWMEDPPLHEFRTWPATELSAATAISILNPLRAARLCVVSERDFGYFHPTRFRLSFQSGWASCTLEWVDELPPEWQAIEDAVRALEVLGRASSGLPRSSAEDDA